MESTKNQLTARMNSIVAGRTTDTEILDARVDADGKTDRGKTAVVFDIEDVIKERYLKTVTEKNGRQVMDDNQLLKNQLLMALA